MSNILKIAAAGLEAAPTGYQIERSLRFNSADSAYLSWTPASATNRKTFTFSAWIKRTALSTRQPFLISTDGVGNNYTELLFNSDDTIRFLSYNSGTKVLDRNTTAVYRDVSSFYHIIVAFDMTDATASNRQRLYVNGTEVTAFTNTTTLAQNSDTWINYNQAHEIFRQAVTSNYGNCYLADVYFVDGQALTPADFGGNNPTTGVWEPLPYIGTYGTNGFHLPFSDNTSTTTIGYDTSGNGNNWTANNFSVTAGADNDSLVDTPTPYGTDTGAGGEVRGNYCTLNPLNKNSSGTLSNGNLQWQASTTSVQVVTATSTIIPSGKTYFELNVVTAAGSGTYYQVGIAPFGKSLSTDIGNSAGNGYSIEQNQNNDTRLRLNGTSVIIATVIQTGDVFQVAVDHASGKLWFGLNDTWYDSSGGTTGDPAAGTNPTATIATDSDWFPAVTKYNTGGSYAINFGQRPFAYTAPAGFKALCTQNLPNPTIADGRDYFNTVLYPGNGTTQAITGVGFQPDFVWLKNRTGTNSHVLIDVVRGGDKILYSELTLDEATSTGGISSWDTDGFTVVADAVNGNSMNISGGSIVAWNWNAGGSNATNTDGTITSTVRANTTAGFSIVTYSGAGSTETVGHGLGVVPDMYIIKRRTGGTEDWYVYTQKIDGSLDYLKLNSTIAKTDSAASNPTTTVFSVSSSTATGASGSTYVAYCFASVEGYSKFGSYTGNGSADGPFVYANHRPAFIMVKRTDTTSNWTIIDTKREGYNVDNDPLYPNLSNAEGTTDLADILSNGFKLRSTDASVNASGGTYIFMSLASNPFKYSLGR